MTHTMRICLISLLLACGIRGQNTTILAGIEFGLLETFITDIAGTVTCMEEDLSQAGNILFSTSACLMVTDGVTVETIAGNCGTTGYLPATGEEALFNQITSFTQLNRTHVVVVDSSNQCIRIVDRVTKTTSTYAGYCLQQGYRDGVLSLFSNPSKVIKSQPDGHRILILDQGGYKLRAIDIETQNVSTVFENLYNSNSMAYVKGSSKLALAGNYLTYLRLSDQVYSTVARSGGPYYSTNFVDNPFQNTLTDILKLDDQVLLVAEAASHVICIIDLDMHRVLKICGGSKQLDAKTDECQLSYPSSLLLKDDYLLIGQSGAIKKIRFRRSNIPAPSACPKKVDAYIKAGMNVAIVTLTDGVKVRLPPGVYRFSIGACNITVIVNKPDLAVRKRVDFMAKYQLGCDIFEKTEVKASLAASARRRIDQIEQICSKDCSSSSTEDIKLTCSDNVVTVLWPTDVILEGSNASIPKRLWDALSSNINDCIRDLLELAYDLNGLQYIKPRPLDKQLPITLVLTAVCSKGLTYNSTDNTCA